MQIENKEWLVNRINMISGFSDSFVAKFLINFYKETPTLKNSPFFQRFSENTILELNKSQINSIKSAKN